MIPAARRVAAIVGVGLAILVVPSTAARAQRVDPERPRTFVVGLPAGARTDRVDAARTGRSLTLPRSTLLVAWRIALGTYIDRGPLVDARGGSYMVSIRGEVIALGSDGAERWRVATGATQPGPAALLSDDTLVFADASGQAVAVRDGSVRWRLRFAIADIDTPSPLPLEDGGVVVATTHELALLDSEGNERAHASLPEPAVGPLLWTKGRVIAVSAGGSVWRWTPGSARPERIGGFGAPIDAGAALADDETLIAVAPSDSTLRAVDLTHGPTALRGTSARGLWRGPPAVVDGLAFLVAFGSGGEQAVAVSASGEELQRATLTAHGSSVVPAAVDAGTAQPLSPGPTPPLVDASGTLAFATSNGAVGVALFAAPGSNRSLDAMPPVTVETIPDACPLAFGMTTGASNSAPRAVAGLAALPGRRLLAVCRSGAVVALTGSRTSDVRAKVL